MQYTIRYTDTMNNEEMILETAMTEFAARGYSAVGVQEIVDAVGVTKPTLYHYFDGKRKLLDAVINRKTTGFLQSFLAASVYEHDLTYSLQKIMKAVMIFAKREPVFFRYFVSLRYAPIDSDEKACAEPVFTIIDQRLLELFTQSVKEHGNIRGKEKLGAVTFWGFCVQLAHFMLDEQASFTDEMLYRSLHQFEHGIYS